MNTTMALYSYVIEQHTSSKCHCFVSADQWCSNLHSVYIGDESGFDPRPRFLVVGVVCFSCAVISTTLLGAPTDIANNNTTVPLSVVVSAYLLRC